MKNSFYVFRLMKVLVILLFIPMLGYSQYYNDVLSYDFAGTPTNGIKIETNMPYVSGKQMPTIMIEGYSYQTGTPIDIKIVYYIYQDKFVKYKAISNSSYTPDIYLSEENGKVVIFIDDQSYFQRFHVRAYAKKNEEASWFEGWTHSDTPKASEPTHEVLVPYDIAVPEPEPEPEVPALPIGINEDGVTQIYAPEGGSFIENGMDVVGAIKIKLPVLYTSTMLKFRVEVFNYLTDKSFTAIISGYNYNASSIWHNCSAQIITSSLDNAHKVYFGDDGTNTIVWIGEADSEWKYLRVRVTEVQATHAGSGVDVWNKNWNVSLDVSDFSDSVNRTVSNTLPVSSGSSIWQNTNDDVYYPNPDGRVGIGTSKLSAELTVNGHIHAKEVRVYTDAGADFVFDENYDLIDIDELEKYVTENKHLPDIASEKEMIEEGLHLGEMNIRLLQKVEELTLYIIDMNKKQEALSAEIEKLKKND